MPWYIISPKINVHYCVIFIKTVKFWYHKYKVFYNIFNHFFYFLVFTDSVRGIGIPNVIFISYNNCVGYLNRNFYNFYFHEYTQDASLTNLIFAKTNDFHRQEWPAIGFWNVSFTDTVIGESHTFIYSRNEFLSNCIEQVLHLLTSSSPESVVKVCNF